MKKFFSTLWGIAFVFISFVIAYEAYLQPNQPNHAVGFAVLAFAMINLPAGLFNLINPIWETLTNIGLALGLPIAWSEAAQVIVTNGLIGYLWWFVAFPKIRKLVQS